MYTSLLRDEGMNQAADSFEREVQELQIEMKVAVDDMRDYVTSNVLNPTDLGQVKFWDKEACNN